MVDAPIVLGLVAVALLLAAIVVLKGGAKEEPAPSAAPAAAAAPAAPPAPNGRLQVFFGSQTGTAEGFAKTIADEARRRGFAPTVVDLEDFEADEFEDADWRAPTMVFAMATYGEGEPTDNSHVFFKWAKAAAKDGGGLLAGAKFAVFGLGNTQYQHFNAMGKLTDELLAALGGERCADLGLGDDDVDLGAAQESEIPNFKGSDLGHFSLVSADFWTSDHLSERSRSMDAFSGTRARGTLTLKRR